MSTTQQDLTLPSLNLDFFKGNGCKAEVVRSATESLFYSHYVGQLPLTRFRLYIQIYILPKLSDTFIVRKQRFFCKIKHNAHSFALSFCYCSQNIHPNSTENFSSYVIVISYTFPFKLQINIRDHTETRICHILQQIINTSIQVDQVQLWKRPYELSVEDRATFLDKTVVKLLFLKMH